METPHKTELQSQLPKHKPFEILLKHFGALGIGPNLTKQAYPLNVKILMGFFVLCFAISGLVIFIFYDANTFIEYVQSIYICTFNTLIFSTLLIIILKVDQLFEVINDWEKLVNTSEFDVNRIRCLLYSIFFFFFFVFLALKFSVSKSIFNEAVRLEHKLSRILFVLVVKMTPPCGALPFLVYSYFIYFTTDLGRDAFQLPAPTW